MATFGQGSPGVRIKLIDNSEVNINTVPNATAGIVGFSSRGAFNKVLRISSTPGMDAILGNGFNKAAFNQGLYAARAVLKNGGFVEFVRPYGEEVTDLSTEKELKSDVFVVSYDYKAAAKQSLIIKHFAATRLEEDGYSDFGKREIFTASEAVLKNNHIDFTLDKSEVDSVVALFAIINEDPSAADRGTDADDLNSDKVTVTTASYKNTYEVTDSMQFASNPDEDDTFTVIDHDGVETVFTFKTVSASATEIEIGGDVEATALNTKVALAAFLTKHVVTVSEDTVTLVAYFGVKDAFDVSTQSRIVTETLDSILTPQDANVKIEHIMMDATLGRNFLNLGLVSEAYLKDSHLDTALTKHYKLSAQGLEIAQVWVTVEYLFAGDTFTFSGTLVPLVFNDTNLFIQQAADSVANGFKFVLNENEALEAAVEEDGFDLGQAVFADVVDVATTANIVLSGLLTVDGVVLSAGMRVLVKNQTNPAHNGIYTVAAGAWTRSSDANDATEFLDGRFVFVTSGSTLADSKWKVLPLTKVVLGTTALSFVDASSEDLPFESTFSMIAFDVEDPAIENSAVWTYSPKNNRSSKILSDAWGLFLDKDKSSADMLVSAGTAVLNLFVRNSEEVDYTVMNAMLEICEKRKDMFALFDGVDELNIETALRKMVGIGSEGDKGRWGAIFDGRSRFFDSTYTKLNVEVVKSVEMAGLITNNRRGGLFWIPPAGQDFGTIPASLASSQKYVRTFNNAEDPTSDIARLYDANINPTRVTEAGTIIYGQKTMLKRTTALNRLNVIMLVAGLHKRFERFLDTKVFQLNTAALRAGITADLSAELSRISAANPAGLLATSRVVCDGSNNTSAIIDSNQLIVDLILFPTRSGEFITLRTTVERTGEEVTTTTQLFG